MSKAKVSTKKDAYKRVLQAITWHCIWTAKLGNWSVEQRALRDVLARLRERMADGSSIDFKATFTWIGLPYFGMPISEDIIDAIDNIDDDAFLDMLIEERCKD